MPAEFMYIEALLPVPRHCGVLSFLESSFLSTLASIHCAVGSIPLKAKLYRDLSSFLPSLLVQQH